MNINFVYSRIVDIIQKINFSLRKFIFTQICYINILSVKEGRIIMLKPLGDRIVIKVIEDTEQTSGGIFIPDSAKEKPQKGEVVSVGEGKMNDKGEREPMDVKAGDVILYAKYAGTDIKMDGVEYKILSVKDALAIIQ